LCATLRYPAIGLAVDAVVLWSTSAAMARRCTALADYVDETLGPEVRSLLVDRER
jgi:hypothetical protein